MKISVGETIGMREHTVSLYFKEQQPTYTMKELVAAIAGINASDERRSTTKRRVEHWLETGILSSQWMDFGPRHLGRGRVRQYPSKSVPALKVLFALADAGLPNDVLKTAAQNMQHIPETITIRLPKACADLILDVHALLRGA